MNVPKQPRAAVLLVLVLALAGCPSRAPVARPSHPPDKALEFRGDPEPPLALSATPAGPAELRLRITPNHPVQAPPTVELSVTGGRQPRTIATTLDPASSSYVASAPITVGDQLIVVMRATAREGGAPLISTARVNTAPLDPTAVVTAYSANGQLSLTVPAGALPPGAWLAFGPAEVPPPRDGVVVREPQLIAAGVPDEKLAQPGVLRFVLPDPQEGGARPAFDPASARIERFDPQRNVWEPQNTEREPVPLVGGLMLRTDRLGIYAVTARRK